MLSVVPVEEARKEQAVVSAKYAAADRRGAKTTLGESPKGCRASS